MLLLGGPGLATFHTRCDLSMLFDDLLICVLMISTDFRWFWSVLLHCYSVQHRLSRAGAQREAYYFQGGFWLLGDFWEVDEGVSDSRGDFWEISERLLVGAALRRAVAGGGILLLFWFSIDYVSIMYWTMMIFHWFSIDFLLTFYWFSIGLLLEIDGFW